MCLRLFVNHAIRQRDGGEGQRQNIDQLQMDTAKNPSFAPRQACLFLLRFANISIYDQVLDA
jgi:hypothetical protein